MEIMHLVCVEFKMAGCVSSLCLLTEHNTVQPLKGEMGEQPLFRHANLIRVHGAYGQFQSDVHALHGTTSYVDFCRNHMLMCNCGLPLVCCLYCWAMLLLSARLRLLRPWCTQKNEAPKIQLGGLGEPQPKSHLVYRSLKYEIWWQ